MSNLDRFKSDFEKLQVLGKALLDSIRIEQYPELFEKHFVDALKRTDFESYRKTLPSFKDHYQSWYSQSLSVVKFFLPDRLNDFVRLYEQPKNRKDVLKENYTIEDYLKDVLITTGYEGKKVLAGPADAIPSFEQQYFILLSTADRFKSSIFDLQQLVQADLLDKELDAAELLLKNKCLRASGVVSGLVLEKHLNQVSINHQIKLSKKLPSISDYNDLLKKHEVYDFATWRFIQILGDTRKLCDNAKNRDPLPDEINDMIIGVDKVIRTVF